MRLLLFRHGLTEANEKRLYAGRTNLPLSAAGREALLAPGLSGSLPPLTGFRVFTSGALRCEQTLSLLYGEVPHGTLSAFREMDFGAFEMHSYAELKDDPRYIAWITGDNEKNETPGGESGLAMQKRVREAFGALLSRGEDVALFTHGGVIACLMAMLFPAQGKNRYEWQPAPGHGYMVVIGPENRYTAF